jgi:A/G-specific adenine glycosylase
MLQQTQASRVEEYYHRFLQVFPTIQVLAESEWNDLLPVWRGLGFYSRGKNMLKTAKIVCKEYNGVFPKNISQLQKLPGIGPYTAAAIMSFSYHMPLPAIDTNLEKVLQRVFGCTKKGVPPRANALFTSVHEKGYLLNNALMDIGAEICKGRSVHCKKCPLQQECHFFHSGKKQEWEKKLSSSRKGKKVPQKKILMEVAVACIHKKGKYLIAKRPPEKGGKWEFPGGKREKGEDWRHCLKREISEELGIEISARPHFFEKTWEEGDYWWCLRFSRCQILHGEPKKREHDNLKWISPEEFDTYNFPKANTKAIHILKNMRG